MQSSNRSGRRALHLCFCRVAMLRLPARRLQYPHVLLWARPARPLRFQFHDRGCTGLYRSRRTNRSGASLATEMPIRGVASMVKDEGSSSLRSIQIAAPHRSVPFSLRAMPNA